jgi:Uma2 family endonuclease
MALQRRPLDLKGFLAQPERKPALEFIDGMVAPNVAPRPRHSRLQGKLVERFNVYAEPRELALAFPELRTTFAGESHVPDVAVYRWERLPVDAAGELLDECREPPDLAIEIIAPGQSVTRLLQVCLWYVEHGVRLALLIDPRERSIVALRPGGQIQAFRRAGQIDLGDAIPGFVLDVAELFSLLHIRRPSG